MTDEMCTYYTGQHIFWCRGFFNWISAAEPKYGIYFWLSALVFEIYSIDRKKIDCVIEISTPSYNR
jgi:hypothetical protein